MKDRQADRPGFRRSKWTLLIAAGIAGLFCGCAHSSQQTLNSLWTSVTPRQWSSRPAEEPVEPRVSANIPDAEPLSDQEVPQKVADAATVDENARYWGLFPTRLRTHQNVQPDQGSTPPSAEQATKSSKLSSEAETLAATGRPNPSSLQRLRTALSLGFEGKTDAMDTSIPGQDQVRLRVENLLTRSRTLADNGELPQANHLAQLAQQMAEESRLEFAPDAQRPVDVIAFLNQLESTKKLSAPEIATTSYAISATESDGPTPESTVRETSRSAAAPALLSANAVMRVNQGFSTTDTKSQVEPEKVVTEIDGQVELLPALAGVDFGAGVEPTREVSRELAAVAAVRERFRAHEAAGSRTPEKPPATISTSPPAVLEPAISLTWTWPSRVETPNVPQDRTGLATAVTIGAIGLATLAAGGWITASRRRRILTSPGLSTSLRR